MAHKLTAQNCPSHVALISHMDEFERLNEPHINLVVLPLAPLPVFNALVKRGSECATLQKYFRRRPGIGINQQVQDFDKQTEASLATIDDGQTTALLQNFSRHYVKQTQASLLVVRMLTKPAEVQLVRPHLDTIPNARGMVDVSDIGMIFFNQDPIGGKELTVAQRRQIDHDCYRNKDNSVTKDTYDAHSPRVMRIAGPAAYMFKGAATSNPLLHASVSRSMMARRLKQTTFRPVWRFDNSVA